MTLLGGRYDAVSLVPPPDRTDAEEQTLPFDHGEPSMDPGPPRATGRPKPARGQLRKINLIMFMPLFAVVGVFIVAKDARNWWEAVILGAGVVATLVCFTRWAGGNVLRVALPCLVVTAAVWPVAVLVIGSSAAFFGVCSVGSFVIPQLPRHRIAAAVGLATYVALAGRPGCWCRMGTLPVCCSSTSSSPLARPWW